MQSRTIRSMPSLRSSACSRPQHRGAPATFNGLLWRHRRGWWRLGRRTRGGIRLAGCGAFLKGLGTRLARRIRRRHRLVAGATADRESDPQQTGGRGRGSRSINHERPSPGENWVPKDELGNDDGKRKVESVDKRADPRSTDRPRTRLARVRVTIRPSLRHRLFRRVAGRFSN